MGKEVESFDQTGDLQPMYGPGVPVQGGYDGGGSYADQVPDWVQAVPPAGYGDSLKDKIERGWSWVARWPRALALGFLWVTVSVWRFTYVVGTGVLIMYALFK